MSNKHERLADRFADIFIRLNNKERLNLKVLADEYGVCNKTINRDLTRIERHLPLVRERGVVYLNNTQHPFTLTHKELSDLIRLIGVHNLLPSMDIRFLKALLQKKSQSTYHIYHHTYENGQIFDELMRQLDTAIAECRVIHCCYGDKKRTIHPYKLIFKEGFWYLMGIENEKLKSYRLSKINDLAISKECFECNEEIDSLIDNDDSIWLGQKEMTVLINVSSKVISYFQQRQILPKQSIIAKQANGNWLIQSTVWHYDELSPIIRCWIPHLTIIEPKEWQDRLEGELRSYLT